MQHRQNKQISDVWNIWADQGRASRPINQPPSRAPTQQECSRLRPGSAGNPAANVGNRAVEKHRATFFTGKKKLIDMRHERNRSTLTQNRGTGNAGDNDEIEHTTPLIPDRPRMPGRTHNSYLQDRLGDNMRIGNGRDGYANRSSVQLGLSEKENMQIGTKSQRIPSPQNLLETHENKSPGTTKTKHMPKSMIGRRIKTTHTIPSAHS
ncbi:uncharacterized protein BO80DRAFT_51417 [Aspergillus ibericus CBS 121593]|uniref:Uncharacterized protein n=1 Tax=Aspergillus ibericus CBS 121593 TaxID=1448316 RepID=A0A395H136_9EURO|nr:hypothetical protein BO80DRAFT_51417 [Aspergillus ibericus CBS 121593]RAL01581.1 hypothetical protein BO80DRAFT_51417 [Aspergillus ibericus CBS 121593]